MGQSPQRKAQTLVRRLQTMDLLRTGHKYREIADKLDISISTVQRDIQASKAEWKQRLADGWGDFIGEALAELDWVIATARRGYMASCMPRVTKQKRLDEKSDGSFLDIKEQTQSGNPKFLTVLAEALKQKSQLLGLTDGTGETPGTEHARQQVLEVVVSTREEASRIRHISEFEAQLPTVDAESVSVVGGDDNGDSNGNGHRPAASEKLNRPPNGRNH